MHAVVGKMCHFYRGVLRFRGDLIALCTPPLYTGEQDCGVHNAVCVEVGLCESPELLVLPVRSVLQPVEQRVTHHGIQTGDQRTEVCITDPHTMELDVCVCVCVCVWCRLFLVQASKAGRQDEVRTFFEKMSDSLHDRKEWKDWFGESLIQISVYTVTDI